ncbi:MAG TPA: glycosyltransferase family 2 protein [Pyrinomonadaceae bacterium]|nr:glycosyltransferase family 2 protein [Pyrinomonadaceae bacterium]
MIPVTLIVTTRNEESNIERCLQSAYGFVDQIFVIDSESEDATPQLAGRYAEVVNLPYQHGKIIPWIYQWGLDNLSIRNEWVMILEADQAITPTLEDELEKLFSSGSIIEDGFYVRREQIFRGRRLRFGGYGSKYMLKLFRRSKAQLDPEETDTRVYVQGKVRKLSSPIIENNQKENDILFYLQKHLRYVETFAQEEALRRRGQAEWKMKPAMFGAPDQRALWRQQTYYRLPLYLRAFGYFFYRYFILLGFLDGKQGAIFHFLQAFWFRLVLDVRLEEILKASSTSSKTTEETVAAPATLQSEPKSAQS